MNCERARAASGQLELAPIRTLKPDALRSGLGAALALARRQGTTLFELRAALDDFELYRAIRRARTRRHHPRGQPVPHQQRVA
ncbi:MAG: hypothetical protein QOF25_3703 [Mycobacterium sp.]|jgi:hypothetical protein|nr:hypothetical protein [Mycobacterium sp.]